jgi:hypothetical protein
MCTTGLSPFQCVFADDGNRYIRSSLSQICDEGTEYETNTILAVFALLQVFLPPLLLLVAIGRCDRESEAFDDVFGHFTNNFVSHAWFFELLRLLRKAVFVMIAVTMGISAEQCFAATALMVVSLAFTALLQPYAVGWITLVDCVGHLVIILCILIGITWCGPDSDPSEAATNGSNVAIVFMVVSFAVVLVVLVI